MNSRQTNLDGGWNFCVNTCPNLESVQFDSTIDLPAYAQLTIDAPAKGPAYFWYRRQLLVPNARPGHQAVITFGAADWHADVWADDRLIASNRGGYLPFEAVLPTDLHGKPTTLTVRVWDAPLFPTGAVDSPTGDSFDSRWLPRGKQHWYGECSGLWQPVHLQVRPAARIRGIKTDLSPDLKTVHISALGTSSEQGSLRVAVSPLDGGALLWESSNSGNLNKGIDI